MLNYVITQESDNIIIYHACASKMLDEVCASAFNFLAIKQEELYLRFKFPT